MAVKYYPLVMVAYIDLEGKSALVEAVRTLYEDEGHIDMARLAWVSEPHVGGLLRMMGTHGEEFVMFEQRRRPE